MGPCCSYREFAISYSICVVYIKIYAEEEADNGEDENTIKDNDLNGIFPVEGNPVL